MRELSYYLNSTTTIKVFVVSSTSTSLKVSVMPVPIVRTKTDKYAINPWTKKQIRVAKGVMFSTEPVKNPVPFPPNTFQTKVHPTGCCGISVVLRAMEGLPIQTLKKNYEGGKLLLYHGADAPEEMTRLNEGFFALGFKWFDSKKDKNLFDYEVMEKLGLKEPRIRSTQYVHDTLFKPNVVIGYSFRSAEIANKSLAPKEDVAKAIILNPTNRHPNYHYQYDAARFFGFRPYLHWVNANYSHALLMMVQGPGWTTNPNEGKEK